MKLFKSLLVAPATLGLLTPMSVTANEINLNDVSNYSEDNIEVNSSSFVDYPTTNPLLAGGEGMVDSHDHDSDSFSETTTASFSADFAVGAVDGKDVTKSEGVETDGDETLQAVYGFQIDLNTSFTGEDSLDISLDAGNGGTGPLSEFDLNGGNDALTVDGVSYTFPIGDSITAIVGDNTDGSALFTTACAYGGPSNTLDDCGNVNAGITNGGVAVGAAYDFDNGFTAAVGYAGPETGIMTDESLDAYGMNIAYTADNWGASVTYGAIEDNTTAVGEENTYTALNAYYTLDNGISFSAGYEIGDIGGAAVTVDESINYFIGVNGEVGPGELGAALGTSGGQIEGQDEELMTEVYYSYPVNDGMTVTPLVYQKEDSTAGNPDEMGVMVKTSFSF